MTNNTFELTEQEEEDGRVENCLVESSFSTNNKHIADVDLFSGVGRMEKREIDELEPYLEKRNGFSWLPQTDTDYYASEAVHANVKFSQHERDVRNIPDYLLWSIGNFFLFFVLGIICIILSVRVREHKRTMNYENTLKISKRALFVNIFSTVVGIAFLVTMLALLINKSSSTF